MKEILTVIFCFLLFVGIVLAILFHQHIRKFKKAIKQAAEAREARRMAEEDAYFKRTTNKHYREEDKPKFKKDYFKRSESEKPNTSQQQQNTRRTMKADGGVTIIDDRNEQKPDRKIFDDSEGEYVEFEEVKE